jgi:hypothetical protein
MESEAQVEMRIRKMDGESEEGEGKSRAVYIPLLVAGRGMPLTPLYFDPSV